MISEKYFSFVVKTEFESKRRFDQCGVVMYLDNENWLKASIEYENEEYQRLGSVVTNHGYSDWATTDIDALVKERRRFPLGCMHAVRRSLPFRQRFVRCG